MKPISHLTRWPIIGLVTATLITFAIYSSEADERLAPASRSIPSETQQLKQALAPVMAQQGSSLQGTALEKIGGKITDEERQEALARVAARHAAEQPTLPAATFVEPLDELELLGNQLRLMARKLDLRAADYEDQGYYDEADRLRDSAKRLRREARTFVAAPAAAVEMPATASEQR